MDATHQIPEVAARIRAVLRRILDRDELTQLPSPLYLHRVLDIWLANNLPTAVLYVRVDHWDEFNSTFGADAWNLLLVVARLLVDALPQADTMASHLGGCDLMAILPRRGAETVAQTLLERYRSLDLPTATLSIAMVTNRHRALVNYVQVSTLLHGLMREVQARGGNGWACD